MMARRSVLCSTGSTARSPRSPPTARPAPAPHRPTRPPGLAEGLRVQLARPGRGRHLQMETRHRGRAALPDGRTTGDRGGHRRRRAEPHARPRTPGVRPHRVTPGRGRAPCVHTADPCNKAIRTLKENFLWVHTFDTIEELRRGLRDFVAHYNATWLVARHGYRTPNQIRAEQRGLAQRPPANLPLAA